jgi:putative FmdB family regulatory protein
MPIYAYKCDSCGHSKDVLQKMSDAPLSECPQCKAATFKKQVTAAGFQLKGSGWYVTDFRGGSSTAAPASAAADSAAASSPAAASGDKAATPAASVTPAAGSSSGETAKPSTAAASSTPAKAA